jgi:hypothetical protein
MDVENAETAAANGIEAQGRAVQADATPFAQAAAARTAILQREPTTQERAAIQQTEAAFQSSGA